MTQNRVSPPHPPACLVRPYPSSQKGGTLIAEDVLDRAEHEMRLADPDRYRPEHCPGCGHGVLHVHDYRTRCLCAEPDKPEIRILRFRCPPPGCSARWQVLPAFVARHLWRSWPVVGTALNERSKTEASEPALPCTPPMATRPPPVPARTRRRWKARLDSLARMLVQVLASSGDAALETVARGLGLDATRREWVIAMNRSLAALAALVHRLVPGIRLI